MITRRRFASGTIAGLGAAALAPKIISPAAFAQGDYPNATIRAICMFPPGTGADIQVRFYANKLQQLCGRNVIVENRVGAFGNIATEAVARAKPDGYTIYIAPGSSVLAAAPHLFNKLNYDPLNSFDHITTLSRVAFMFCTSTNAPFKTMAEMTAYLKEKGDTASYGASANTGVVAAALYKAAFGLKTVHVNYRTPQLGFAEMEKGQLAFYITDPGTAAAYINQGKVRPLAMSSAQRMKANPDVPSAAEAGIPNLDVVAWWSVHTPAGTPKPILDNLEDWFNRITRDPETGKFLTKVGGDIFPGNTASTRALLIEEMKAWENYVKIANIQKL